MAKKIKNSFEVRAIISVCEGDPCVDSAKLCYSVICEHDMEEVRMLILQNSDKLRAAVHDLGEEVVKQVDIHEEIPEMDSLLTWPPEPPA